MPRIIITEPGKSPQPYRITLDRTSTTFGRGSDNNIVIEAGSASTNHCVMKRIDGGFILEDLGSTNGIKIDDNRFRIIDLEDGNIYKIGGDVEMEYTLSEEEVAELSKEDFKPHQAAQLPTAPPPSPPKDEPKEDEVIPLEKMEDRIPPQVSQEEDEYGEKRSKSPLLIIIVALLALALGYGLRHFKESKFPTPATPEAPVEEAVAPEQ
jgi:predicted component of type VI protein secretion system